MTSTRKCPLLRNRILYYVVGISYWETWCLLIDTIFSLFLFLLIYNLLQCKFYVCPRVVIVALRLRVDAYGTELFQICSIRHVDGILQNSCPNGRKWLPMDLNGVVKIHSKPYFCRFCCGLLAGPPQNWQRWVGHQTYIHQEYSWHIPPTEGCNVSHCIGI